MDIISKLIFHCNNCDANTAFVTIRESTAAAPSNSLINAKVTFKGTAPTNYFLTDSYVNECPTTLSQTVFTQKNLYVADFLQSAILDGNRPFCTLSPPLGSLESA